MRCFAPQVPVNELNTRSEQQLPTWKLPTPEGHSGLAGLRDEVDRPLLDAVQPGDVLRPRVLLLRLVLVHLPSKNIMIHYSLGRLKLNSSKNYVI